MAGKKLVKRNAGLIALKRAGRTPIQIASESGAPIGAVRQWLGGHRKPVLLLRKKLQVLYGIAPELWDREPEQRPAAEEAETRAAQVASLHDVLLATIQQNLHTIKTDPAATPEWKNKLGNQCVRDLTKLAELNGETGKISEAKILRTPQWSRIRDALANALKPWPEALRAAGHAINALDG